MLKRLVLVVATAVVVGVFVDVVLGGEDFLSARAWLGAAAAITVAILLRDLVASSSVEHAKLVPAWSVRRPRRTSRGPSGLENTHAVLLNATTSPRAYTNHLRPRLAELARHYFPLRQGIDMENDLDRVAEKLGDVAWLIDPTVNDRSPSMSDIERFLVITLGDPGITPIAGGQPQTEAL